MGYPAAESCASKEKNSLIGRCALVSPAKRLRQGAVQLLPNQPLRPCPCSHTKDSRIRVETFISLTYVEVEVELENDKTAEQLELYTGVKQSCVQVCHPESDWIRKHNTTSRCHPAGEEPPKIDPDV
eukprot:scaffold2944_cov155-Skeletonema_dohrnii-CCMP3373.AAC.44